MTKVGRRRIQTSKKRLFLDSVIPVHEMVDLVIGYKVGLVKHIMGTFTKRRVELEIG
jgi:hypothetical protein